ncbi:PREDICTED: LOW QUALITY PROTEIN: RING finger protein 207 [Sturnus vulgaris]|uniref:LOW QUALITY PROTEIN: RING finger protein 207 n=1 Tax=Sturnus vulgaris TaxID=9172 RepID=UPI00071A21DC|nr:PREDICTED: LOW QUALITY PROTEIN: RING finger protein 207 [Sturnus vulgaris]
MAGGIFSPLESCSELEKANCHPLVCLLCHEPYQHPCLLDCYHNFCASCLRGRASDGRLRCPLCGHPSVVRGGTGLPPVDRLLQFLVDSSADSEEDVQCANCDRCCTKAELDTMYFCNTCGQPLCAPCREETHRARMFTRHEIVSLSKRTKDIHKKCPLHEEPYIMFSTEKKSMLCINCFRDMQGESRAHCIDIETAYMQGCQRLDQAVMVGRAGGCGGGVGVQCCPLHCNHPCTPQAVKELQTSTREAIVLLKAMIEEVRNSASEEEAAINSLFSRMQEQLSERKKTLLKAVQSQHEEKEKAFKEQLAHLASLLPTLQVHLVTCSAFLSSANKAEFLDLGYQLMERLQRIVKLPHRLRPAQTSKINSEYRAEFARCLEPLLMLSPRRSVVGSAGGIGPGITGTNMLPGGQCSKTLMVPSCPPTSDKMSTGPMVKKPTMHRYISTKVLLAEGRETPFAEHCRNYENTYRMLQTEIQGLKDQVQELHRDLTKHHSLIKSEIMSEILQKSLQMDVQIAAHYSAVEMMRSVFEEVWEETYQRVANEQEIYEGTGDPVLLHVPPVPALWGWPCPSPLLSPPAQLHDLLQLRQENSCLSTITKQIAPYVRSIAKVKERLEPRLQEPQEPKEEQAQMLLKICDDSEVVPRDASPGSNKGDSSSPGEGFMLRDTPEDPSPKNKDCCRGQQKSGAESATLKELAP